MIQILRITAYYRCKINGRKLNIGLTNDKLLIQ